MKVLNLYAGVGGNRKLWKDVDVTAVEIEPKIAKIYQDFFPDDKVIVTDAHQYLLEHYNNGWDFIWSSPPCPTHSRIRNIAGIGRGTHKPVYPDMRLYEEIIFLNNIYHSRGCLFKGKYCIENVISYYTPLISPQTLNNHFFWTNFKIGNKRFKSRGVGTKSIAEMEEIKGFTSKGSPIRKDTYLKNILIPELGKHIFDCAFKTVQNHLVEG